MVSKVSNLKTRKKQEVSALQQRSISRSKLETVFESRWSNVIWLVTVELSKSCDTSSSVKLKCGLTAIIRERRTQLLTSAQRSAEVRALQCALSFYISMFLYFGVCMSAVCGLRFTDFRQITFFVQAKISVQLILLFINKIAQKRSSPKRGEKCILLQFWSNKMAFFSWCWP